MKLQTFALAALPAVIAAPGIFSPDSVIEIAGQALDSAQKWLSGVEVDAHKWSVAEDDVVSDLSAETVSLGGIECE